MTRTIRAISSSCQNNRLGFTTAIFSANARQGTLLWCDFCIQELILVNEKIVLIYG